VHVIKGDLSHTIFKSEWKGFDGVGRCFKGV